ncbi:MAG: amidohydrolase family protein, partial [Chloroflexi bacterium]|nr:amidohydrolase family protein [Chloroflexota bacterium]
MPEPPAWKFQQIIKPMWDLPSGHWLLKGRVLTCRGNEVIENGFVEIEGARIKAVGAGADLGSDMLDVVETGGTLLPGLFNNHAHLGWDAIHVLAHQSIGDAPEITAYKCATNMLFNLKGGVTTVRDLGMKKSNIFAKQAVEQGIFLGPRLLISGEAIVQTGGHTYWCCREASGPDEMRQAVREQVRAGADWIKILACHDTIEFTDAELEAVIDEAHRNGLPITAHATFDAVISRVVRFGVDCVEHAGSMSDATIQLLLDRKVPIVTTFSPMVLQSDPEIARRHG